MRSVREWRTQGAMTATHTGARNWRNIPTATPFSRIATKNRSSDTASIAPIRRRRGQTARSRAPAKGCRRANTALRAAPATTKRITSSALSGAVAHSTSVPISPMIANDPATSA